MINIKNLSEVATIFDSLHQTPKYDNNTGYKIIRVVDIKEGALSLKNALDVDYDTYKQYTKKYTPKKGDIIITRVGSYGICSYVNDGRSFCLGQNLALIHPIIDSKYLYYCLISPFVKQQIESVVVGTTQKTLSLFNIANLKIITPTEQEQKAIADVLSSFDDKIELNKKIIKNLEEQAQSLYKHWFVDFEFPNEECKPYKSSGGKFKESELGLIPDDWNIKKIKDLSNCLLGGTPSRNNENYWNGDIPWINSGKVNEFRIVEPSEYITKEGLNKSATKLLKEKTIVIAITGATLGQISILEIESCANQSVVGVENTKDLPYEYLYCTLLNRIEDLLSNQTGGAQQHINKDNVENFNLIYNKNAVNAFQKLVSDYFDQQSKLIKENKKLEETRDYLLQKLMSGEIEIK